MLRRGFGLPSDSDGPQALAAAMAGIDRAAVKTLAAALQAAGNVTATRNAAALHDWLALAAPAGTPGAVEATWRTKPMSPTYTAPNTVATHATSPSRGSLRPKAPTPASTIPTATRRMPLSPAGRHAASTFSVTLLSASLIVHGPE